MAQVVCEGKVAREAVRERLIEVEHLEQPVPLDGVQVAVGEGAHVGSGLPDSTIFPKRVPEHVTLTC